MMAAAELDVVGVGVGVSVSVNVGVGVSVGATVGVSVGVKVGVGVPGVGVTVGVRVGVLVGVDVGVRVGVHGSGIHTALTALKRLACDPWRVSAVACRENWPPLRRMPSMSGSDAATRSKRLCVTSPSHLPPPALLSV